MNPLPILILATLDIKVRLVGMVLNQHVCSPVNLSTGPQEELPLGTFMTGILPELCPRSPAGSTDRQVPLRGDIPDGEESKSAVHGLQGP